MLKNITHSPPRSNGVELPAQAFSCKMLGDSFEPGFDHEWLNHELSDYPVNNGHDQQSQSPSSHGDTASDWSNMSMENFRDLPEVPDWAVPDPLPPPNTEQSPREMLLAPVLQDQWPDRPTTNMLFAATDGSGPSAADKSIYSRALAGWGEAVRLNGSVQDFYGSVEVESCQRFYFGADQGTNNTGGTSAMTVAFQFFTDSTPPGPSLVVHYDSEFAAHMVQGIWAPKSNHVLISIAQEWFRRASAHGDVRFQWVRGHSGEFWNERADANAKKGASGILQACPLPVAEQSHSQSPPTSAFCPNKSITPVISRPLLDQNLDEDPRRPLQPLSAHVAAVQTADKRPLHLRMRACSGYWRDTIKAPPRVLRWVAEGVLLPFKRTPKPVFFENHASTLEHQGLIDEEVGPLLSSARIRHVGSVAQRRARGQREFAASLLVAIHPHTLKPRVCLNAIPLNKFRHTYETEYGDLARFAPALRKGWFWTSLDLKSCYHHLELHDRH